MLVKQREKAEITNNLKSNLLKQVADKKKEIEEAVAEAKN